MKKNQQAWLPHVARRLPVGIFGTLRGGPPVGARFETIADWNLDGIGGRPRNFPVQLHAPLGGVLDSELIRELQNEIRHSHLSVDCLIYGARGECYDTIELMRQTVGLGIGDCNERAKRVSEIIALAIQAKKLGIICIQGHLGELGLPGSDHFKGVVKATRTVCRALKKLGMLFSVETGPETAIRLLDFIDRVACSNLRLNFDCANGILYGTVRESTELLHFLRSVLPRVRSVHLKDARPHPHLPRIEWGTEVPFGQGYVPVSQVLQLLAAANRRIPLIVEREFKETRGSKEKGMYETANFAQQAVSLLK